MYHEPSDTRHAPSRIATSVPAGTCAWMTAELIEQTLRVWEPHYGRTLSAEEAVEILTSVGLLLDALIAPHRPTHGANEAQSA